MNPAEPAKFDIHKLHAHQQRRDVEKQKLYDRVLKRVYHRVETAAMHDTQCIFAVPGFVLGMPLYDAYQCSGYLVQKLKTDGFKVTYYHPNIIHLNWSPKVVRLAAAAQPAPPTQNATTASGSNKKAVEYKPTGKLFL